MGKLVTFVRRERPASRSARAADAEILIFTGVRYERDGIPAPKRRSDPDKPRRKRV